MAEVLVEFPDVVLTAEDGRYTARACGAPVESGQWHGWIEFVDLDTGDTLRSPRETTQPNRADTVYWATGLTAVYLEGALGRARHAARKRPERAETAPAFDGPAPQRPAEGTGPESILNPFSVYRKGEALLRRQLSALSVWHLVNIVRDHRLSDLPAATLNNLTATELVDLIVGAVRLRTDGAVKG